MFFMEMVNSQNVDSGVNCLSILAYPCLDSRPLECCSSENRGNHPENAVYSQNPNTSQGESCWGQAPALQRGTIHA